MSPRLIVLALLQLRGESSGLDLVRSSQGRLNRGTIYVHLTILEDVGDVVSSPKGGSEGQRLYRITDQGQATLLTLHCGS